MTERRAEPPWEIPVLLTVAGAALALRFVRLDLGWFGVDQARDVAIALDIVGGRAWPVVGPTMRRVTRLGALYHYFWALPYLVSRDPLAGYWFAACLSVVGLVLTWRVARTLWGPAAGAVTAIVAAGHPIWIVDGRVLWAPAALPFVAALLTWLAVGRESAAGAALTRGRLVLIGGLLGLAVQLHLTMVGWVLGFVVLAILDRPPLRALLPALAAGIVVGAPALWAMLPASDTGEGGLGALATRAPHPALAPRLTALAMLPARVLGAFSHWPDGGLVAGPLLGGATALLAFVVAAGLVRLLARALRGERSARVVLLPAGVTAVLVLRLPGDAWYYYLDSVLPLCALAAGALVANAAGPAARATVGRSSRPTTLARTLAIVCAVAASTVLALCTGDWLRRVDAAGYLAVEPFGLTLDGEPRRDLATAGRVTTVAVKRRAAAVAATLGGDFETLWHRVHGPAFADATGDNGFWFRWALEHTARGASEVPPPATAARHLAFWYRDDPTALRVAAAATSGGVARLPIGPLFAVRYPPLVDYESCRSDQERITVPIRVTPDPRRYGDGSAELPATLPAIVTCELHARPALAAAAEEDDLRARAAASRRLVVAAVGGDGSVAMAADEYAAPPAGDRPDADDPASAGQAALCAGAETRAVRLTIARHADAPAELDLYDVPLGAGCEPPAPAAAER